MSVTSSITHGVGALAAPLQRAVEDSTPNLVHAVEHAAPDTGDATLGAALVRSQAADHVAAAIQEDPTAATDVARRLAGHDATQRWTHGELGELTGFLRDEQTPARLGLPTSLAGVRALPRLVSSARPEDASSIGAITRYMSVWRPLVEQAGATGGGAGTPTRDALAELTTRITAHTRPDAAGWNEIATLLDAAGDSVPRRLATLPGADPFSDVARRLANGSGDVSTARRYVDAWRVHSNESLRAPDVRRARALDLLSRDADTLTSADWRELGGLADADLDRSVFADKASTADLPDVGTLVTPLSNGVRATVQTQRALTAWHAAIDGIADDPSRLSTEARRLIEKLGSGSATDGELRRFGALLDVDPAGEVLEGPRQLAGAPSLDELLTRSVGRAHSPDIARYTAAWRLRLDGELDDPDAVQREVTQLVSSSRSAITPARWQRLAALLDADSDGAILRVPASAPRTEALAAMAARAGRGLPIAEADATRNLAMWRLGLDAERSEPRMFTARVDALLEDRSLTRAEWREFGAMVDLGASRTGMKVPDVGGPSTAFRADVEHLATSGVVPSELVTRTRAAMRLAREYNSTSGRQGVRAALVAQLTANGQDSVRAEQRAYIRALSDAFDELPGLGRMSDQDRTRLTDMIHGRGGPMMPTDPIVDAWLHELDPTIVSERRAAARRGIVGGRLPTGFTISDLAELDEAWDRRTPFERLAIESGVGLHSEPNPSIARDFVKRLLDLPHAPAQMPRELSPIWSETRRLAEINESRMAGRTPKGAVPGYRGHPDYAEIGRIAANIELIRRLTPVEHDAGPALANLSPAGSADAEGVIEW